MGKKRRAYRILFGKCEGRKIHVVFIKRTKRK
jgi:hypothetical protein